MKKVLLTGVAVLAIAGSTVVYAQQHRPWIQEHMRMSPEDRAAFTDARIAAVHAGLKLTPDQEKLWPPLEAAVRDFAKMRIDRANARMNPKSDDASKDGQAQDDPVARLRERADNMATSGAALKKIADAADPLYKTLDDGQKRRLKILTHMERRFDGGGWRHREFDRDGDRDHDGRDRDGRDRGYDRDGGRSRDHGGPERL
jgi:LTXXQ motif family protein